MEATESQDMERPPEPERKKEKIAALGIVALVVSVVVVMVYLYPQKDVKGAEEEVQAEPAHHGNTYMQVLM